MYHPHVIRLFLVLLTGLFLINYAPFAEASEKDRMLARLPEINKLKDSGLVGENNQGYLAFVTAKQPNKKLIQAENKDRRTVYGRIAKNQGVDIKLVGQRRAKQIAEKGSKGHRFQDKNGKWYTK